MKRASTQVNFPQCEFSLYENIKLNEFKDYCYNEFEKIFNDYRSVNSHIKYNTEVLVKASQGIMEYIIKKYFDENLWITEYKIESSLARTPDFFNNFQLIFVIDIKSRSNIRVQLAVSFIV